MTKTERPARTTPISLDWRLPVAWVLIVLAAFAGLTVFFALLVGAPLAMVALVLAFSAWVRAANAGNTFFGPVVTFVAAGVVLLGGLMWANHVESMMFPA